ncbi:MAG TPA: methionyl-tRNA formyltransferase [Hyphomicrobiaceae bacterium]|nr:methionyl-tRNA formyltransferase [Hyphomicrobiaceae bacterium]
MTLRIIFMGTPDFAVPTLSECLAAGHDVAAVYSQPPRPAGRGLAESRSPVHEFALASGLEVRTPRSLRSEEEQAALKALGTDVAVVVAYGLILPQAVLDAPRLGCFNLHASLLPRWRGAAPIQRAIMAGDHETAACVMRMEAGLDTGPVCLVERVEITPAMTAGDLHDLLARQGAGLMVRALAALERGSLTETPQPAEGVTYAAKIEKAEARIDLGRPAREVLNHIHGLSPFPGAWLEAGPAGARERLKVIRAEITAGRGPAGELLDDRLTVACGSGAVRLVEVQRAGKRPMSAEELLRGFQLRRGDRLG